MSSYASPLDKLLTYGYPEEHAEKTWPDYLALGLTTEHIPELLRMVTDKDLLTADCEETPACWVLYMLCGRLDNCVISVRFNHCSLLPVC
jgi:hypothetical protein